MPVPEGITNYYKLYLNPVIALREGAYTASIKLRLPVYCERIAMKIAHFAFSILSITILLAVSGGKAFANPAQRAWREELRAMQQQQSWSEQPVRNERTDRRANNIPQHVNTVEEQSKRQGKMSAEERRALRRQINEVGRDIYAPSR